MDSRFRIALAIAAIEAVHKKPHGSAKDELVAVAKALRLSEDLVTESVVDEFFQYGCDGPQPEEYADKAVSLLDHEATARQALYGA